MSESREERWAMQAHAWSEANALAPSGFPIGTPRTLAAIAYAEGLRTGYAEGVRDEREACADLVERMTIAISDHWESWEAMGRTRSAITAAIRARGEETKP